MPPTDVVCFEDDIILKKIEDDFGIDFNTMIDKNIKMKIEKLIEMKGWTWDDITSDYTQRRLF